MSNQLIFCLLYLLIAAHVFLGFCFFEKRTNKHCRFGIEACTFFSLIWPVTTAIIFILIPIVFAANLVAGIYSRIVEHNNDY